jgi:gas vesicle structural protein
MAVERAAAGSSLIDVLDRVLDKGIVIDAYVRVSLVGIDLVSVEARIVVASVETYLKFAEAIGMSSFAARPLMAPPPVANTEMDRLLAENAELKRRLDELS